jgi:hypothetical protein
MPCRFEAAGGRSSSAKPPHRLQLSEEEPAADTNACSDDEQEGASVEA